MLQTIGDNAELISGKGTKGNFFGFLEFYRSKKEDSGSHQMFTLTPTSSNALDASIPRMAPEASRTTKIVAETNCVILEVSIYLYMYIYIYDIHVSIYAHIYPA